MPSEGNGVENEAATRPGETVQQFLRRVTRPWHDAVEAAFAAHDLATVEGLRAFLVRQAAAVIPLEEALTRAGIDALIPDWRARRRGAALAADLHALGASLAPPVRPVHLPSRTHALGGLYVLEGSKLGGRMLARRVMTSPDPQVRAAASFLHGHEPGGWARFVAVLDAYPAVPARLGALRAGADAAFALFRAAALADGAAGLAAGPATPLVHFSRA